MNFEENDDSNIIQLVKTVWFVVLYPVCLVVACNCKGSLHIEREKIIPKRDWRNPEVEEEGWSFYCIFPQLYWTAAIEMEEIQEKSKLFLKNMMMQFKKAVEEYKEDQEFNRKMSINLFGRWENEGKWEGKWWENEHGYGRFQGLQWLLLIAKLHGFQGLRRVWFVFGSPIPIRIMEVGEEREKLSEESS